MSFVKFQWEGGLQGLTMVQWARVPVTTPSGCCHFRTLPYVCELLFLPRTDIECMRPSPWALIRHSTEIPHRCSCSFRSHAKRTDENSFWEQLYIYVTKSTPVVTSALTVRVSRPRTIRWREKNPKILDDSSKIDISEPTWCRWRVRNYKKKVERRKQTNLGHV